MTTNYHTAFGVNDVINIQQINSRLSDLDAAIDTQAGAAASVSAALLYDSKATTTDGGSSSATTWNTRTLNTEVDPDSIVTLSSNQFTPISGTYVIQAIAPGYVVNRHRLRLYNVTQTSTVLEGVNSFASSGNSSSATLYYIFTANGTDAYRIDHYTQTANATDGLGLAVDDGADEIYAQVLLLKIG